MGEKLLSPPLIEALCEFRFRPTGPWDWTLPGRLYDQIGTEFAERSQVEAVEVVQLERGKSPLPQMTNRFRMKRPDGSAMVQISPYLLAVNYLRLYPNWETFRTLILRIFKKYMERCGACNIQRVGLRYINQIPLPESRCELESLISVAPPLKGALDRSLGGFYQRYEIPFDSPRGTLIHQTGIQKKDQETMLMLDLDFGSQEFEGLSDQLAVENWLNQAHDVIYECFVESLNPDLYEKFKRGTR
jgi:uncharacterized protein (TIGR04255 family)